MILAKAIKPSRLRDDKMRQELLNAIRRMGTQVRKDFAATTATWDHKPKFEEVISLTGPGPVILVGTDDEIYGYVDKGTGKYAGGDEYPIEPVNARVLAFQETYTAKTVPGVIGSKGGGKSGKMVFRPYVIHPGIKPRNFSIEIKKKWDSRFKREMEAAMRKARDASGHAA